MNSSKEKVPCIQCEQYKKELQEKDNKIKILENNILKIKSLLSESGSLIDGYNEVMEENKNLKIEIENLKNQINLAYNNNYQFELLKQKVLRFQQENQELKATKQFYESQSRGKENIKDSNETKIKRELSLKDKEINQLNTVISLLKLHSNDQQLTNDEIIKKYSKSKVNNNSIDEDEIMLMENDNNNHEFEYRRNTNYLNNNIKMIELYKEKEFLSDEYQRYKQKYIIYKFKYHEFKKTTKLFLNYMKVIPSGNNISNFFDNFNDKKSLNFIGTKRLKSFNEKDEIKTSDYLYNNINAIRNININNQIRKKSEDNFKDILKMPSLFNNSNNTFLDNDEINNDGDNIKLVNTEEKENNNKNRNETPNIKKRGRKKIIELQEEDEEEENKKSEISKTEEKEKVKKESKKRGRKSKKEKEKKENENNKKSLNSKKVINDNEDEGKESKENSVNNQKENNNVKKDNKIKSEEKGKKGSIKKNTKEKEKENIIKEEEIKKDIEKNIINNNEIKSNEDKKEEKEEEKEKEKEKEKEIEKEKEKEIEKEKNKSRENIGPIPKKKKIDPIAQKTLNINNLLNLLSNNPDKITEANLNLILSLQNTINEKISFLFEIITSNLIKIELSKVLSLFEVFIDISGDSKTIIGINIIENINSHLNTNSLLNKKMHLKIANKSNEKYKNYINKNYSQAIYLISFLLDILYRKLSDISCVNNFIFQLVFDKNIDDKIKNNMLIVLVNTIMENKIENISNDKIYFKEEIMTRYLSKENQNKFYFFLSYKNSLVSKNIINLILSIYNKKNINNDAEIINQFNVIFSCIPEDEELKIYVPKFLEEYKSSIRFNSNIFYLEIFQALTIIVEIKDMKWISENIFANIFWKNFNSSKKDSLKRALCIFYSSVLFYLCLKNEIKNHGNDNLLEQQEFSRLYAWLYGIYNAQQQFELQRPPLDRCSTDSQ